MPGLINAPISPDDAAKALDLLQQVRALLAPGLHSLTPTERKTLYKMGPKSVGFMQSLVNYATASPDLVPKFVDLPALQLDVAVAATLDPLAQYAAQLALDLSSTQMLAGSEGMDQATPVYQNIKFLAAQNQPGAQGAYDELRKHFANRPSNKKPVKPA